MVFDEGGRLVGNLIADLFATVVTLPVLGWILIYVFTLKMTGSKKRAVRLSADLTTFFFIFSVYFISHEIWHVFFGWLIIAILAITLLFFAYLRWSLMEDLVIKKIIKAMWRFNFLFFGLAYFVLFLYGIFTRLLSV